MLEELNLTTEQLEGVQKYVQKETDKVRTKYTKQIKDLESKVPRELTEEEKAFEKRVKDLETKEKELARKEMLTNAKGILTGKGLDVQLADFIKFEGVEDLEFGSFAENITTEGIVLYELPVGTKLKIGDTIQEVTQIGKECHTGCAIAQKVGECVMPKEGIFTKVLQAGKVKVGDSIEEIE